MKKKIIAAALHTMPQGRAGVLPVRRYLLVLIFLLAIAIAVSCGGGGGGGDGGGGNPGGGGSPATYAIGGAVSGLFGTGLVLQNNSGDNLAVSGNGDFAFATPLANGAGYAVTILTQPSGHNCIITNGSGTISAANITNVAVACQSGHMLDANTVALWRLNENSASSDAVDETGSYNLTQFGSPDIISGQIGSGRLLNGSTKFFQKQGDANLGTALNGDWTYEGWVYLDPSFTIAANLFIYNGLEFSLINKDTILAEVGVTAGRNIYWHQWQNTSAYTEVLSNATLQTGQFYHIAVSRTAQGGNLYTYRLYLNGVIDTTTTSVAGLSYAVSGASHYIGLGNYTGSRGLGDGGNILNGRIDDTRISKVARSDAEILLSYKRGRGDTTAVVIDIDYNVYNTVTIGTQVWMKENLKVTKYRNGEAIPTTTADISGETAPKYQWAYGGNESNVADYGRLYTWYATTDSRAVCPINWHVPTDAEWTTLTDYLGGEAVAGGKMKEAGTTHWSTPNTGADNSSGWTALPGGYRSSDGTFYSIGGNGDWWSATEGGATYAWSRYLYYNDTVADRDSSYEYYGFSVRCVRD